MGDAYLERDLAGINAVAPGEPYNALIVPPIVFWFLKVLRSLVNCASLEGSDW